MASGPDWTDTFYDSMGRCHVGGVEVTADQYIATKALELWDDTEAPAELRARAAPAACAHCPECVATAGA